MYDFECFIHFGKHYQFMFVISFIFHGIFESFSFCFSVQCNAPPNMCVLESNALNTWYQARVQCEGTTSRLATVNLTTNAYFKQKVMFNDPVYWTAFHRKQVVVWSYGKQNYYTLSCCIKYMYLLIFIDPSYYLHLWNRFWFCTHCLGLMHVRVLFSRSVHSRWNLSRLNSSLLVREKTRTVLAFDFDFACFVVKWARFRVQMRSNLITKSDRMDRPG